MLLESHKIEELGMADGIRRAALVTGSGRGIGRAIAQALSTDHNIVLQYRARADEAEMAAAACRAAGAQVLIAQADIADPVSVAGLADAALARFGRIDTLVQNAATGLHWPISISGWDQVALSVQVLAGSFAELVKRLSPGMIGGSRIVAISGLDQKFAVSDHGLTGAGKAALDAMVRNLAVELGPRGITVNSVVPGATRTESLRRAMERKPGAEQPMVDCIPLGRMGEPEDVAKVVRFLCSADAQFVTGTSILVDGGFSAGVIWTRQQAISFEAGTWSDRPLGH
jgi:NAD(P)-dependent dehydrogenase (short-subunit alcohol dehydrogenase family)